MAISAVKLWGLRRMADGGGRFKMTAVDQRPPIKSAIAKARGLAEAPYADVYGFKRMLIETLQGESTALLLDPHFVLSQGLSFLDPTKGLIITLEDSLFKETEGGRLSAEIDAWSVEKIKRVGGDAVKVLAWYRPDADPAVCRAQQDFTKRIGEACARYDIPFLFELLVYPLAADAHQTKDYIEMKGKRADHVLDSVRAFAPADFGIDVFKLESPIAADDVPGTDGDGAAEAQALFDEMGRIAGRPWVMLSAGANKTAFRRILTHAYKAGASGYLAGRAIWQDAFRAFPDWDAIRAGLEGDSVAYMRDLNALTDAQALPWQDHPVFAGDTAAAHAGAGFRHAYSGF